MATAHIHTFPAPSWKLATAFLANTVGDHIHLVAITPDGPTTGRWFGNDAVAAVAWASDQNQQGRNIYWTVNVVRAGLNKKPAKVDMTAARFLHVDIDPPKDGRPFDRAGTLEMLSDAKLPPSFVTDSGNGLQAFWRIEGPGQNLSAVEDLNKRIAILFGGDNCHNIDRLMRVPGSVNHPDERKRRRGRVPTVASIIVADAGEIVEPEDMHFVLPPLPPEERTPRERVQLQGVTPIALDDLKLTTVDPLLEMIQSRDPSNRSERVLRVAGMMVRRDMDDRTIAGVLLNPDLGISEHCFDQPDPMRPVRRAIGRARADHKAPGTATSRGGDGEPPKSSSGRKSDVSEDSIALAFTQQHGGDLLFDHHVGKWFRWTGVFWEMDETNLALDFARTLARMLADGDRGLGRASTAAGVEKMARADRTHAVTSAAWDQDPLLLGTPTGTIDLKTGVLSDPNRDDRITRQTGCAPDHGEPTRWLQFLDESLGGDRELVKFLQLWCGYCLTGLTSAHALLFIYGPGGNGKSVFLNSILNILGTYGAVAAMETFTASKHDRHSTELAMLRGARLVTASETEEGRAWAEAKIKAMTGGDPITARFMRQDNFTFRPQFKLTIAGNHAPSLRTVDDAMRRRFNIAPFILKPASPDRMLEEKLKAEYPQILAWAIAGARAFLASGLTRPAAVVAATDEYFSEQDVFGQWFEERCEETPGRFDACAKFYADWVAFSKAHGEEPGSLKSFGTNMGKRGYKSSARRDLGVVGKVYSGVALRPAEAADDGF